MYYDVSLTRPLPHNAGQTRPDQSTCAADQTRPQCLCCTLVSSPCGACDSKRAGRGAGGPGLGSRRRRRRHR
eukprot:3190632-Rhodomonas_salina.1